MSKVESGAGCHDFLQSEGSLAVETFENCTQVLTETMELLSKTHDIFASYKIWFQNDKELCLLKGVSNSQMDNAIKNLKLCASQCHLAVESAAQAKRDIQDYSTFVDPSHQLPRTKSESVDSKAEHFQTEPVIRDLQCPAVHVPFTRAIYELACDELALNRVDFRKNVLSLFTGNPSMQIGNIVDRFCFIEIGLSILGSAGYALNVFFRQHMFSWWTLSFGSAICIPYLCVLWLSLQVDLLWLTFKRPYTYYIIFSMLMFYAAAIHRDFHSSNGLQFLLTTPNYVLMVLAISSMAVADAFPPHVRTVLLRYVSPILSIIFSFVAVTQRLPGAEEHAGYRTLAVFGVETWSNMDVSAKFSFALVLLFARPAIFAWRRPDRLAFLRGSELVMSCSADTVGQISSSRQHPPARYIIP